MESTMLRRPSSALLCPHRRLAVPLTRGRGRLPSPAIFSFLKASEPTEATRQPKKGADLKGEGSSKLRPTDKTVIPAELDSAAVTAAYAELCKQPKPLDKYVYLRKLLNFDRPTYYKLLRAHTSEILSLIYTPTVGDACLNYHKLPITTNGLYFRLGKDSKADMARKLREWPNQDIKVVVMTDGERILGLGDLGANGMGISEGKIQLYTAAAGVDPKQCLPMALDVGTANIDLLEDPAYKGIKEDRPENPAYDEFIGNVMSSLAEWAEERKSALTIQFEDFGNTQAFRLLDRYRNTHCCFNDDIQGTAAVCLAGILAALRLITLESSIGGWSPNPHMLKDQRVVFLGAGEAGTGIGELLALWMVKREGVSSMEEARKRCFFVDSQGLVCKSRQKLQHHKIPFAHDVEFQPTLAATVEALRPTVLIGVSTVHGAFDENIVHLMSSYNERPIIFPLSNPTSKAECNFMDACSWTHGHVVFASGSPFPALRAPDGTELHPAQANNAYIFPAIGHAAMLTKSKTLPDEVFLASAEALASVQKLKDLHAGWLFPPFEEIHRVSARVMAHVADTLVAGGHSTGAPQELLELQDLRRTREDAPANTLMSFQEEEVWEPEVQYMLRQMWGVEAADRG